MLLKRTKGERVIALEITLKEGNRQARNISNTGGAIGNIQNQNPSLPVPIPNACEDIGIARNENSEELMSDQCQGAARYTIGNNSRLSDGICDARVRHMNDKR